MSHSTTPFAPKGESTLALAVGPAPVVAEVNPGPGRCRRLRLFVAGEATVFVEMAGPGGVASPLRSMPLPGNSVAILTAQGAHISAVTEGGAATLYVTPGEGG